MDRRHPAASHVTLDSLKNFNDRLPVQQSRR
jgi:hypothetical protein